MLWMRNSKELRSLSLLVLGPRTRACDIAASYRILPGEHNEPSIAKIPRCDGLTGAVGTFTTSFVKFLS